MKPRRVGSNVGCRPTLACNHEEKCLMLGYATPAGMRSRRGVSNVGCTLPTLACNDEEECLMLGVRYLRWHAITKRSV